VARADRTVAIEPLFTTFHSNTYVIRDQVEGDTVIIGRIFHTLEDR
jgi:plasmid stabilization system protein ParE